MLKVVILTRRRPDLSREAFDRHLREIHLPLVARMPGLRRLVASRVLDDPSGQPPAWDVVGEDWFDDAAAFAAAIASPEGQAVFADAPNFTDPEGSRFLLVEEAEIPLPAPRAATATVPPERSYWRAGDDCA